MLLRYINESARVCAVICPEFDFATKPWSCPYNHLVSFRL
jgi:hypothetical protein